MNVDDIAIEDGHWLAGITDGEGYFSLITRRRRLERYPDRLYHAVQWTYGIALRADDSALLHGVQSILKVGHVRPFDTAHDMRDPVTGRTYHSHPRVAFRVVNRVDVGRIVATFERFPLRSKKAHDFAIWAHAWHLYHANMTVTQRKIFQSGNISRPSLKKRRPLLRDPLKRFYSIPDDVWLEMDRFAEQLKTGRQYVEPTPRL